MQSIGITVFPDCQNSCAGRISVDYVMSCLFLFFTGGTNFTKKSEEQEFTKALNARIQTKTKLENVTVEKVAPIRIIFA